LGRTHARKKPDVEVGLCPPKNRNQKAKTLIPNLNLI